ncbi:MBL fold metallo-hydrolase [Dyadobacter arcticus]|uniref:Beta-lactamase superfamily II metal-dependent hydrolase n=1 Tax=Dyadobacter arcticus TaxID=1078754 RepID=A0ABX0UNT5_9BACT|nr:MBL fold metallo-hydrolase [Dyadobacter arcticus]NIJ54592.1 beta-lactamase superfamily II metal-dependent hydrolase [Dyadobacter arcticus]
MKFDVNFLPARYGDCIWIEYGNNSKTHRILIDGGTSGTKADIRKLIKALPEDQRHFELIVVTHIDRDHIEGILSLLEEEELAFEVDDFWFNGWQHLPEDEDEVLGPVQGERLTATITKHNITWNKAFGKKAVVIPGSGDLPKIQLPGGMTITLLSPLIKNLVDLRPKWEKEVKDAGMVPGFGALPVPDVEDDEEHLGLLPDVNALNDEDFHEDKAAANGSSIAFLGSFGGKTVFFGGDSFPSVVLDSLNKLYDDKAPVDLVKLSHHASAHNTSPELIEKFDCNKYLISTNGSNYHHPSAVTIARVIKRGGAGVELNFNYRSEDNEVWDSPTLKNKHSYKAIFPKEGKVGLKITVI